MTTIANFFHLIVEWLPFILIGVFLLGFYSAALYTIYLNLFSKDKHGL